MQSSVVVQTLALLARAGVHVGPRRDHFLFVTAVAPHTVGAVIERLVESVHCAPLSRYLTSECADEERRAAAVGIFLAQRPLTAHQIGVLERTISVLALDPAAVGTVEMVYAPIAPPASEPFGPPSPPGDEEELHSPIVSLMSFDTSATSTSLAIRSLSLSSPSRSPSPSPSPPSPSSFASSFMSCSIAPMSPLAFDLAPTPAKPLPPPTEKKSFSSRRRMTSQRALEAADDVSPQRPATKPLPILSIRKIRHRNITNFSPKKQPPRKRRRTIRFDPSVGAPPPPPVVPAAPVPAAPVPAAPLAPIAAPLAPVARPVRRRSISQPGRMPCTSPGITKSVPRLRLIDQVSHRAMSAEM